MKKIIRTFLLCAAILLSICYLLDIIVNKAPLIQYFDPLTSHLFIVLNFLVDYTPNVRLDLDYYRVKHGEVMASVFGKPKHLYKRLLRIARLIDENKIDRAMMRLNKQSQRCHDDEEWCSVHYLIALCYYQRKNYTLAEHYLVQIVAKQVNLRSTYVLLAKVHHKQQRYDEAIESYQAAIKQFRPRMFTGEYDTDILQLIGTIYLEMGEWERAVSYGKAGLEKDPKHVPSASLLVTAYELMGQRDSANEYLYLALSNSKEATALDKTIHHYRAAFAE